MVQASERVEFVGRAAELATLGRALERTRAGRGTVTVVAGEAGIGKSRLVQAFADGPARDWRTIRGGCLELVAGELPYAPFVEALREVVRETPPERRPALLGPARADLERLLPELAERAGSRSSPPVDADPMAQHRLFEVILGLLERISRSTPVLLIVEDLQWADPASLDLLGFLGRALRDDPVLTLVTVRSEALIRGGPVLSAVAGWEREEHVVRIDVPPFGVDEVRAQVSALGFDPAPDVLAALVARSDGNPLFVDQLVRPGLAGAAGGSAGTSLTAPMGVEDIPPALRDALTTRIEALDEEDRAVLRAAAAAGRRIEDSLLSAVVERPAHLAAASLRRIVDAGILVRDEGRDQYRFRHALIREVTYATLFGGERVRLHRAIADDLQSRLDRGDPSVSAGEIAYHRDAAGELAPAFVAALTAARDAERVYAYVDAHRLYERVLELWHRVPDPATLVGIDRAGVAERAAETAMLAGHAARAVALASDALTALDVGAEPLRAGLLHERLRWFLWESGDRAAAAIAVEDALRLIPADPPSAARARAVAHQAGLELYARDYEASRDHAREAIEIARSVSAGGEEALALAILGWDEALLGEVDRGLARFADAGRIARELNSPEGQALAATNLAALLDRVGRPSESLVAAEEGLQVVRALGVARTYGGLLAGYAVKALVALGRWDEAERAAAHGLREAFTDRSVLWLLANRARLHIGRGRYADAEADIAHAFTLDERLGGSEFRVNLLAATAEAAVWQGQIDKVRSVVDEVARTIDPVGPPDPATAWIAALGLRAEADAAALARARHDDTALTRARARAAEIVTALEAARRDSPSASVVADTPRGRGLGLLCDAEARRVERKDRPSDWSDVADAWGEAGRPFPAAYARYREAEAALSTRGDRADAATALRAADATATGLGAGPLHAAIGLLAGHARIRLAQVPAQDGRVAEAARDRDDPVTALRLTDREAEILRLVAGGWTNRQIGDALFITRKTASVHVSNILGKLGAGSRVEAAAIAHRLGLGRDAPPPPGSEG